ncbi:MAG: hypothetical protein ACYTG0_24840 [Planctomycetota bacterium]|jgi:hypothetical protein
MKVNTGRLTPMVAAVLSVALVVATAATPIAAARPADKGKPKTPADFQVETNITHYHNGWVGWYDQEGAFVSTGMIDDAGPAEEEFRYGDVIPMTLSGEHGEIAILIYVKKVRIVRNEPGDPREYEGRFEVIGGTGAYANLEASGPASGVSKTFVISAPWLSEATTHWQLEGFITAW